MPELSAERPQESPFEVIAGGEAHMPALRRLNPIARAVPHEKPLAEPRSGADHRDGSPLRSRAPLQRLDVVGPEQRQAVPNGCEVVDQARLRDPDGRAELTLLDRPGQVGAAVVPVDHGSGDAEAGAFRLD